MKTKTETYCNVVSVRWTASWGLENDSAGTARSVAAAKREARRCYGGADAEIRVYDGDRLVAHERNTLSYRTGQYQWRAVEDTEVQYLTR